MMNVSDTGTCIDNSGISTSVNFLYDRCPICDIIGKSLACSKCIAENKIGFLVLQQGQLHDHRPKLASVMYIPRLLKETLQQFCDTAEDCNGIKDRVKEKIELLSRKAELESEISYCTSRVQRLKKLIAERKNKLQTEKNLLHESKKSYSTIQKRISKTLQKKIKLNEYITKKKNYITTSTDKLQCVDDDLRVCRRDYISMLTQHIFPIREVKPGNVPSSEEDSFGSEEKKLLREELDEARRLSFVHGRWVDLRSASCEFVQISVVTDSARALPDGDYSSYETWLQANHSLTATDPPTLSSSVTDSGAVRGIPQARSVLAIGVVLCHAAQMLLVIRKVLGIHLPHKIHYGTFTNPTISPHVFINNVKLLNCNLLSVCLQQGVDGNTLHPLHTLRNLQILTEKLTQDGERKLPYLPSPSILQSMEVTLALADVSDDDSDSDPDLEALDWQLSFDVDWDSSLPGETTASSLPQAYVSTNAQSSILSQPAGLVTSALNWATKGWWGREAD